MKNETIQTQFAKIYDEYSNVIFRFSILRVSNREQAIDITQETFTRLWQSLLSGTKIVNPKVYLFTITHRLIIDYYRKKKSLSLDDLTDKGTSEPYEPIEEGAENRIETEAEGRYLINALSRLKTSNRQILYLKFVEGLSSGEMGDILGISANAASVRVNRGINELREITGYDIPEKNN